MSKENHTIFPKTHIFIHNSFMRSPIDVSKESSFTNDIRLCSVQYTPGMCDPLIFKSEVM